MPIFKRFLRRFKRKDKEVMSIPGGKEPIYESNIIIKFDQDKKKDK